MYVFCHMQSHIKLTVLMLKTEYSGLGINIMPDEALAPIVTSVSAGIAWTVQDGHHALLF